MRYDYIVVGGGSAGCVMASRLSEDPRKSVLLLEAGDDTPPGRVPDDILDSFPHKATYNRRYHWVGLQASRPGVGEGGPPVSVKNYEQGRIMGGSSSINAMMAIRALPSDFDSWVSSGAEGWSWQEVLPFFRKVENDLNFDGDGHSSAGRLPIRRVPRSLWPAFSEKACQAFERAGVPYRADHNDGSSEGVYPMPINNLDDKRVSSAIAYLDGEVRSRPNLTIVSRVHVEQVELENSRITGVSATIDGRRIRMDGNEVIVCCGALHSPTLLMRSGIGDPLALTAAGIVVRRALKGVGSNLQDHPTVGIASFLTPEARLDGSLRRHLLFGVRYSSHHPDCPPGDMYVLAANQVAWHSIGRRFGALLAWVNKSYSRGHLRLSPHDPGGEPDVYLNLLSDDRDLDRLAQAFRFVARIYQDPDLKESALEPFAASYGQRERQLSAHTYRNRILAALGGGAMDASSAIRRQIVRRFVAPNGGLSALLSDDRLLREWVKANVTHGWHACGTCRMGSVEDPLAVVDSRCRVIGVEGLRVVDASVMPSIVSANTNLTTMMIAEKIADQMQTEGMRSVAVDAN